MKGVRGDREREGGGQGERETERERESQTDRQTDRQTETETETDRQTDRENRADLTGANSKGLNISFFTRRNPFYLTE